MISKHLIPALIFLITTVAIEAQEKWIAEKSGTTANLNSIQMIGQNYGWVVGGNGVMLYKNKDRWELSPKITGEDLHSVFLLEQGDGWAVGGGGTILRLEANKWRKYPSPARETLYDVEFFDAEQGIAVGANGTILKYDNGEWKLCLTGITKGNFYCVSATEETVMVAGGMEYGSVPIVTFHKDHMEDFTKSYDHGYLEIFDIALSNMRHSFAVGTAGTIMCDEGLSWTRDKIFNKIPTLNCVAFRDDSDGISAGYFGTIIRYSDSGWKMEKVPVKAALKGVCICETAYYAVGEKGTILSKIRIPGGQDNQTVSSSSAIQVEAYPNPSSDLIKIIIPREDDFVAAEIAITNQYGQIISNNVLNPDLAGQVYRINTSEMKDGLYMIRITSANSKTALGKFIVKH
ncbi:MAG: T9SS type A sorting domain-containing protein [Bacteroidales bacterium]|nr:T9SS type A sorting domain-containing protein [Bacteroidales bacterium]HPY66821.1 YCF48-related protein [Bacteroidales bacterium]HQB35951.1 YCF48-related protein [Bacteroidales bacterium]